MGKENNETIKNTGVKDAIENIKTKVTTSLDVNGDGEVNIVDIITLGMKAPGISIERDKFLRKEFANHCTQEMIDEAVITGPMQSNIPQATIDKIASDIITFERNCVSGISTALGMPGGLAMAATIPADIVQYYGYLLRVAQKLMYLYGFKQLDLESTETELDSATVNTLTLCFGVMYGVAGANTAMKVMATALAKGVSSKFMKTAVTKGVLYPIVKSTLKWFGVNLTKKMCTQVFTKAIPFVGGVLGGALTYATFKPCCDKLQKSLKDTSLSNPIYISSEEENILSKDISED